MLIIAKNEDMVGDFPKWLDTLLSTGAMPSEYHEKLDQNFKEPLSYFNCPN